MEIVIPKNFEYRIEVGEHQKYKVMVIGGLAEVDGQELLNDKWYVFQHIRIGIFSFTGAKIRVDGDTEMAYLSGSSIAPQVFGYFDERMGERIIMKMKNCDKSNCNDKVNFSDKSNCNDKVNFSDKSNCNDKLNSDDMSNFNDKLNSDSKVFTVNTIMVIGHGRTTFCATFINYMLRMHQKVMFAEIDPGRGNIFPGTLGCMIVDQIVDYQDRFRLNNPKCFFFGNTDVENIDLFDKQVDALFKIIRTKMEGHFNVVLAPMMDDERVDALVERLGIDEVVVVGNERMFHSHKFRSPKVFIENNTYVCSNNISKSISAYFNGTSGQFSPSSFTVKQKWAIVRIGEEYVAPDSALPIGAVRKVDKLGINRVELQKNTVLAISEAKREEDIITTPVAGFVVCLDPTNFRILSPQPKLPSGIFLIQGSFKYSE